EAEMLRARAQRLTISLVAAHDLFRLAASGVEPHVAALPEMPRDLEVRVRPVDAREIEHVDARRVVPRPADRIPIVLERHAVSGRSQPARLPPDPRDDGRATGEKIKDLQIDHRVRLNRKDRDRDGALARGHGLCWPDSLLLAFELGACRLRVEEDREAFVAARVADERATVAVDARDRAHDEELRVHLSAPASRARGEIRRTETPGHPMDLTRCG